MMSAPVVLLCLVILFAFIINIPLGWLRDRAEKFTLGWYLYVHLSVPAIIFARIKVGLGWKFIPLTLAGAVAGQLLGGIIHNRGEKK
jgi:hypothetical protein